MLKIRSVFQCDVCQHVSEEFDTDYNDFEIKQFLKIKNGPYWTLIIKLEAPWEVCDDKLVCSKVCKSKLQPN